MDHFSLDTDTCIASLSVHAPLNGMSQGLEHMVDCPSVDIVADAHKFCST